MDVFVNFQLLWALSGDFQQLWTLCGNFLKYTKYYTKFKDRELKAAQLEVQLARTQMQMISMQLNPHFLFNTLNGI